ncbi:MAG: hypothetical protein K0R29_850 [Pseudobdellovibrio sp.]|jgi:hypothetical protein|nr:hypothetical protein [Pseudobdellovibrio sp.]
MIKSSLFLSLLFFTTFSFARTEICPDRSPSEISPKVKVKVTFDNKKNWYRYEYTLVNQADARVPIWRFSIEAESEPVNTGHPEGWEPAVFDKKAREIYWVYKAEKNSTLKPDKSLAGFQIVSKKEPGLVKFYADGDVADTPIVKFENDEDEVDPQSIACPGFYNGEGNSDYVVGATRGPAITNRLEVKMRARKVGMSAWGGSLNLPGELEVSPIDYDQMDVVLMGTKNIDVTKIEFKTLEFGPGKATFVPVKKVFVTEFGDLTDDEFMQAIKKSKSQHLMLTFNTYDLEARCNVDHALFLTAKLGSKNLMGAVNVKPDVCDKKTFAREAKKEKYRGKAP